MKKKISYLLCLIVLPAILFYGVMFLYNVKGEFFLFKNYDGPYGLLFSSLNLTRLISPGFFQHPGIVPTIFTAIVIKITYLTSGANSNIAMDIIDRPEFYLNSLYFTICIIVVSSLFFLGFVTYRKTGNIFAAVFLQFTPFISVMIIYQICQNITEATSVFLILLLLSVSISYINENNFSKRNFFLYIILFGIISGLGLANKISIIPVMIIPFLLIRKFKYKFLFILISIATFSMFFFPVSPDVLKFFKTLYLNIFKTGLYSAGPSDYAESSQITSQLILILNKYFLFSISYILIFLTVSLQFVPRFKESIRNNKYYLFLVGILAVMTSFILLVLKSHIDYYIMPGILFSVVSLFVISSIFSDLFPNFNSRKKYAILYIFFILLFIPQISSYKAYFEVYSQRNKESNKIINYIKINHPNLIYISTDYASSKPNALSNGFLYSNTELPYYDSLLMNKYPNYIYFNAWKKEFMYLKFDRDLQNRLVNSDTLLFHSSKPGGYADFKNELLTITKKTNVELKEVFSNRNGEELYLVLLN